jgi:hypothetical protein
MSSGATSGRENGGKCSSTGTPTRDYGFFWLWAGDPALELRGRLHVWRPGCRGSAGERENRQNANRRRFGDGSACGRSGNDRHGRFAYVSSRPDPAATRARRSSQAQAEGVMVALMTDGKCSDIGALLASATASAGEAALLYPSPTSGSRTFQNGTTAGPTRDPRAPSGRTSCLAAPDRRDRKFCCHERRRHRSGCCPGSP